MTSSYFTLIVDWWLNQNQPNIGLKENILSKNETEKQPFFFPLQAYLVLGLRNKERELYR